MDLSLTGKKAIITGGSRGIGFEIAKSLISEGVNVVIAARDPVRLRNSAALLEKAYGVSVHHISYDIKDTVQVESMVQEAKEMLSGLDILINNGAPAGGAGYAIESITDENIWEKLDAKTVGYLRCTRAAVPHMKANGWGRIINVAGMAARNASTIPGGIRNAGVVVLSKVTSEDLGRFGITVNTVHPGGVRITEEPGKWKSPTTGDIANLVAFLCSPDAACLTGESIGVAAGGG